MLNLLLASALLGCDPSGADIEGTENALPTVATVDVTPDPAFAGDSLSCVYFGFRDGDDDPDRCTIEWTINGNTAAIGRPTLDAGFVSGDEVTCTVIPSDGVEEGEPISHTVTIQNTAPTLAGVTLTPLDPATDEPITAVAVGAGDADAEAVSVALTWTVDGEVIDATSTTLDPEWFGRDQSVAVTATPLDESGLAGAPVVSEPVVIANTPPEGLRLDIVPAAPRPGQDDLRCDVRTPAEDIDGDEVSYTFEWTLDGQVFDAVGTIMYDGDTVPASATAANQSWTCSVTPSDGADDGAEEQVSLGLAFPRVAAGRYHACAIDWERSLECWGDDAYGQVSDTPVGAFRDVTAGDFHSCALSADGSVYCWGRDDEGQVSGAEEASGLGITRLAAGWFNTCGVYGEGQLHCWGDDSHGIVSNVPEGADYREIAVGGLHACALDGDGDVLCWGNDDEGQLAAPFLQSYQRLSAGSLHSCVLGDGGQATCWGRDDEGQSSQPAGSFAAISAGWRHSCGVSGEGALRCWGGDTDGQVSGLPQSGEYVQVSAGGAMSCAVDEDGEVSCWGALGDP